jgi:hypothetical protein
MESGTGWTLIDGVDLNLLKPQQAIDRADNVGRTFWKYSQLASEGQTGTIRKIGVVLNGLSHLKPREHDAHDYALHRLKAGADTAIDASSTEATANLERGTSSDRVTRREVAPRHNGHALAYGNPLLSAPADNNHQSLQPRDGNRSAK